MLPNLVICGSIYVLGHLGPLIAKSAALEGRHVLACFGPLGTKLDAVVVTTAFAGVNYVEKVSGHARRASLARVARLFAQKCELFLDFSEFASE